ncbi:hypothetical protein GCM10022253_30940 [Sphingomonas endophytica]|uniref:Dipeptidyl aminopeptidase/acylaminoacyl peptidase n=1 Tax=Sphingomonas endophytica TaxID=869719 RepID=A0ABR6N6W1_9SPHN|nr:prolyl oligopeptidase family serine peptidase [Sphingomonas endophytica]MBB5726540.1 dipeptidyl aminopeptidase/acylaminoacyl peptidase [Sphingomonas endophytica]
MLKMVTRGLAIMLVAVAGPAIAAPSPSTIADETIVSREAWRAPFATRAEWLAFVGAAPGGAEAARRYDALYPQDDYYRWTQGRTIGISRIVYRSGGLAIRGLLLEPRTPGRHPVLIYNHGGVGEWGRIIVPDVLAMSRLAERGYVVLASTFRGEGGSEGKPDMGGGDIDDTLTLIDVATTLPTADTARVGMWGFSRGGYTTYGALAKSRRIAAAVIEGGPTDLVHAARRAEFDRHVYPDVIPGYANDKDGILARRSPITWPEQLAPDAAILILHGGGDPRVEPTDALRMATALQRLKRSYRLKIYEGGGHDLIADMVDVRAEMERWFDRYVRDRVTPPKNEAVPVADGP